MGDKEDLYVPGIDELDYQMTLEVAALYLRRFGFTHITKEVLQHNAASFPDSFTWSGVPTMSVKAANDLIQNRKDGHWLYAYRDDPPRFNTAIAIYEEVEVDPLTVMREFTKGEISVYEDTETNAHFIEKDDVNVLLRAIGAKKPSGTTERIRPPAKLIYGPAKPSVDTDNATECISSEMKVLGIGAMRFPKTEGLVFAMHHGPDRVPNDIIWDALRELAAVVTKQDKRVDNICMALFGFHHSQLSILLSTYGIRD